MFIQIVCVAKSTVDSSATIFETMKNPSRMKTCSTAAELEMRHMSVTFSLSNLKSPRRP